MTGGDVALLVVAAAAVVGVVLLALGLRTVARALHRLERTVEQLHLDTTRTLQGGPAAHVASGEGASEGAARRRDAGSLLARAAVANPYLDVSDPVIKVLALASGTSRAASRFRRSRREA